MLRTFFKADLPQVLAIENAVHVVPWGAETFKMCLQEGYAGWVLEVDKKIIGFIFAALNMHECHILNVCVAHDYQRQGYGRLLIDNTLSHAKKQGVDIIYLEVRRSNVRAISLYRQMAFHLVGERKNYYPTVTGNEDALVFARSLQDLC